MRKKRNKINIKSIIKNYVISNIKEYSIITMFFLIGIFLGVIFINNTNDFQKDEINTYISTYITNLKESKNINNIELLKNDIKDNLILFFILWFSGTTIIGIPIVVGLIAYRGFCLGYTIAACTYIMGTSKGIAFTSITMILHNIIFIPLLISLGVSGIKLYRTIVKDKRKENIKLAITRHTIYSVILLIGVIIASLVKVYISGGLLSCFIKYF